jgi:SAM-dependent methyltransferase
MSGQTERLDALAYGNRRECLLHIRRYFFAADQVGNYREAYEIETILDAACGHGYGCFILSGNHPTKRIVGIDISGAVIRSCKALYDRKNISYVQRDVNEAPKADAIVSMETIEHVPNWQDVFSHLVSVSKILIFSVPWKQLANPESKMFHKAFGLYDQSFADLIPEGKVAEWYCQRRYDAEILPISEVPEDIRAFLIGVVREKLEEDEPEKEPEK